MTDWKKILKNAPVRSFRTILQELAGFRQQNVEHLPVISVFMQNGQRFSGMVVAYEQGHQYDFFVLHQVSEDRFQPVNSIFYLNASEITGLGFEDTDANELVQQVVSGGKIIIRKTLEPVSKLLFQRFLKEKSDMLANKISADFTLEVENKVLTYTEDFADFKNYVEKTVKILDDLLEDELGKESLQKNVSKLTFGIADLFSVKTEARTLQIYFDKTALTNQNLSEKSLLEAIEKNL